MGRGGNLTCPLCLTGFTRTTDGRHHPPYETHIGQLDSDLTWSLGCWRERGAWVLEKEGPGTWIPLPCL